MTALQYLLQTVGETIDEYRNRYSSSETFGMKRIYLNAITDKLIMYDRMVSNSPRMSVYRDQHMEFMDT